MSDQYHIPQMEEQVNGPETASLHTRMDALDLSEHRYEPLQGAQSIRLLRFSFAPSTTERLSCKIKEVDRSSSPSYIALSYVWSDASTLVPMTLSGGIVHITANLDEALRHLAKTFHETELLFWVDALCINQSNENEKSHQVAQMADIYREARLVIAWLGPGGKGTKALLKFINHHHEICYAGPEHNLEDCDLAMSAELIDALHYLLSIPYWTRIWTVQETLVPKQIRLWCGHQSISWDAFFRFLSIDQPFKSSAHPATLSDIQDLKASIIDLHAWPQQQVELALALHWTSSRFSSDTRDILYAVLGLAGKCNGRNLRADYSMSACMTYCAAIRAMCLDWRDYRYRDLAYTTVQPMLDGIRKCIDAAGQATLSIFFPVGKGDVVEALRSKCDGVECGSQKAMRALAREFSLQVGGAAHHILL